LATTFTSNHALEEAILVKKIGLMLVIAIGGPNCTVYPSGETPKLAELLVQRLQDSPPKYEFCLRNLSTSPLRSISLGHSEPPVMVILNDNIPTAIESPEGWHGQTIYGYETEFMKILWQLNRGGGGIQAGRSQRGFVVTMPEWSGREWIGPSGQPVRALPLLSAPYAVRFSGGTEFNGVVKEVAKMPADCLPPAHPSTRPATESEQTRPHVE
jgi:hypothetical protein